LPAESFLGRGDKGKRRTSPLHAILMTQEGRGEEKNGTAQGEKGAKHRSGAKRKKKRVFFCHRRQGGGKGGAHKREERKKER